MLAVILFIKQHLKIAHAPEMMCVCILRKHVIAQQRYQNYCPFCDWAVLFL